MYNKTHDFMMRDKLRGNGEKLKDGFVRVAALTPKIKVADCDYNTERIIELIKEASQKKDIHVEIYFCRRHFLRVQREVS